MSDEQYSTPLISEAADPLTHLTGNEYELGWRSVWIITPRGNKVRVLETPEGHIETVVRRPERIQEMEVQSLGYKVWAITVLSTQKPSRPLPSPRSFDGGVITCVIIVVCILGYVVFRE